ncbi:MAG: OmpA family protein [Gammaproteobacteria bacterium]|nr:OmpA family protein [Gammaproteobacteria bacterium]
MHSITKRYALLIATNILFAGCSYNPFTTNNHLTGNVAGTTVGAVAGAGTAAIFTSQKAVIGLAGLAGGLVGYYMTTLDFASGGIKRAGGDVYTQGQLVTINLSADYLFDSNSADLLPEAGPALNSAIKVLAYFPDDNIIVSGNSAGFGTSKRDQQLSERRARVIAQYLTLHGVDAFQASNTRVRKLTYVGYGNYFPISNDTTAVGLNQNSRIQITGYLSNSQLKLSGKEKFFANIGKDEEPLHMYTPAEPNVDYAFQEDHMPESFPNRNREPVWKK